MPIETEKRLSLKEKVSYGLSGFLSGIGLGLVGYVPNVAQTAGALIGIKALLLLYPVLALTLAMIIVGFMYKLTDKQHAQIVTELHQRS